MRPDYGSVLAIETYARASQGVRQGIACCHDEGHQLTELQQLILWRCMLQAMDGLGRELEESIKLDSFLSRLGKEAP